jgi:hypothetical protein
MTRLIKTSFVVAALLCFSVAATAATITITFDDVPVDIQCDEVWYEQGIAMWFTTANADECGEGSCNFGVGDGEVWLYPATLAIDLSNVFNITSIEADYEDGCPGECENAYLFFQDVLVDEDHGDNNPLIVETGSEPVDMLRVNGCEDGFTEIRIIGDDVVPADLSTWGAVKAIYR